MDTSENTARIIRTGDTVRCLLGTALEHETRVNATEIRDGRQYLELDSNRGMGCSVPASSVRLVRSAAESGPLEDAHGPVAGGHAHAGADLQAPLGFVAAVTRAEFDALVSRLVDHSKRISDLAGRIHVIEEAESPPGQAFDELARRLDERVVRIDRTLETHLDHFKGLHHVSGRDSDHIDALYRRADDLAAKIDGVIEAAEKGDLALADGLDAMQERIRQLAAQLAEIKRPVDHLLDHFMVGGLRLRDHVAASAPDA